MQQAVGSRGWCYRWCCGPGPDAALSGVQVSECPSVPVCLCLPHAFVCVVSWSLKPARLVREPLGFWPASWSRQVAFYLSTTSATSSTTMTTTPSPSRLKHPHLHHRLAALTLSDSATTRAKTT